MIFKVKNGSCVVDEITGGVIYDFRGRRCHMNEAGFFLDESTPPWNGTRITLDDVIYQVAKQLERRGEDRSFLMKCFFSNGKKCGISDDTMKAIGSSSIVIDKEYCDFLDTLSSIRPDKRAMVIASLNEFIKIFKESCKK